MYYVSLSNVMSKRLSLLGTEEDLEVMFLISEKPLDSLGRVGRGKFHFLS